MSSLRFWVDELSEYSLRKKEMEIYWNILKIKLIVREAITVLFVFVNSYYRKLYNRTAMKFV